MKYLKGKISNGKKAGEMSISSGVEDMQIYREVGNT